MAQDRVFYFTTLRHRYTLKRWFDPAPSAEDPEVVQVTYDDLSRFDGARLPLGSYVFTDLDRLPSKKMRQSVALARRVQEAGGRRCVANWPNLVRNRFELLTLLRRTGINDYGCSRFDAHEKISRYPVFLRILGEHKGPASDLLHDGRELGQAIQKLLDDGARREDILIVEFQETDRFRDHFLTYGAYCAFGKVFPVDVAAAASWVAKYNVRSYSDDILRFESEWIRLNPHAAAIAQAFRVARIDWGRMDFSVYKGRIQVFEINTNPDLIANMTWNNEARRNDHLLPVELPAIRAAFARLAAGAGVYERRKEVAPAGAAAFDHPL